MTDFEIKWEEKLSWFVNDDCYLNFISTFRDADLNWDIARLVFGYEGLIIVLCLANQTSVFIHVFYSVL